MKKRSLVGLKATDIVSLLARDRVFALTSYTTAIALVIPAAFESKREFLSLMEHVADEVFK